MRDRDKQKEFCGNCDSHNSFDYPNRVFCSTRYGKDKDPIVHTLWSCSEWNKVSQGCYCVREALKQQRKK
jgi:hypothetical protein